MYPFHTHSWGYALWCTTVLGSAPDIWGRALLDQLGLTDQRWSLHLLPEICSGSLPCISRIAYWRFGQGRVWWSLCCLGQQQIPQGTNKHYYLQIATIGSHVCYLWLSGLMRGAVAGKNLSADAFKCLLRDQTRTVSHADPWWRVAQSVSMQIHLPCFVSRWGQAEIAVPKHWTRLRRDLWPSRREPPRLPSSHHQHWLTG
jgi:hypothetical protein